MNEGLTQVGIESLRYIAKKHNAERVIVLYSNGEKFGFTSYGKNREYCKQTKEIAETLEDVFMRELVRLRNEQS